MSVICVIVLEVGSEWEHVGSEWGVRVYEYMGV